MDEDEVTSEPTDRGFWEKRGSKKTLQITDALLDLVKEVEPNASLNYTKHYISVKVDGSTMNFVTFMPRKAHVLMGFKLPQTQDLDEEISEADVDPMTYDTAWKQYRLRINGELDESERSLIRSLPERAHGTYGKAS